MAHLDGPGNVIIGPGGEVVGRPSQVPTGIASHVSFLVREVKGIKEAMKRKVIACEADRKEQEEEGKPRKDLPIQWLPWAFDWFTDGLPSDVFNFGDKD